MKRIWGSRLKSASLREGRGSSGSEKGLKGPLCGGAPFVNGGLNQGQLVSGSPANIPAGLPILTDCSCDRRIEVLKRQG